MCTDEIRLYTHGPRQIGIAAIAGIDPMLLAQTDHRISKTHHQQAAQGGIKRGDGKRWQHMKILRGHPVYGEVSNTFSAVLVGIMVVKPWPDRFISPT